MSLSKCDKASMIGIGIIMLAFFLAVAFGFGQAYERKTHICKCSRAQCMKYTDDDAQYERLIKRLLGAAK